MVIWVVGRNYPLQENGMQGSFELEQAKMLSRFGNDVFYLACSLHPTKRIKGKSGIQSWLDDGVKVYSLSSFFAPRVYPFYFIKGRNKQWLKLLNEVESKNGTPDVIHIHYPAMLMISEALEVFHKKGVRLVATEHWTKVFNKELDKVEMREYIKLSGILDTMICVGTPLARVVSELTEKDVVLIPNIVTGIFKPSNVAHDGFRFVSVGRLVKLKQFDKIIEAFVECFKEKKDISLTIIGEGTEKENLQTLIEEHNAVDQIQLVGGQTRETTAKIVSNSDALICYSIYETFGVPIVEAWSCGIPTITSNTAAAAIDYYDDSLGTKVSPNDFEELKAALKNMYYSHEKYDKKRIFSFAHNNFSEEAVCNRLMKTYTE